MNAKDAIAILPCGPLNLNTGVAAKYDIKTIEEPGKRHLTLLQCVSGDLMVVTGDGESWPTFLKKADLWFQHDQTRRSVGSGSWKVLVDAANTESGLSQIKARVMQIRGRAKVGLAVLK